MELFKKKETKIMSDEELEELEKNIYSRRKEAELRDEQRIIEDKLKSKSKGLNFDIDKIKRWLIIGVAGLAISLVLFKIIGKFI